MFMTRKLYNIICLLYQGHVLKHALMCSLAILLQFNGEFGIVDKQKWDTANIVGAERDDIS